AFPLAGSAPEDVSIPDFAPALYPRAEMCPGDGRTMLHQAAGLGALRWMKWLLDRGADVNRNSHQGWTPLDYAATGGVETGSSTTRSSNVRQPFSSSTVLNSVRSPPQPWARGTTDCFCATKQGVSSRAVAVLSTAEGVAFCR